MEIWQDLKLIENKSDSNLKEGKTDDDVRGTLSNT